MINKPEDVRSAAALITVNVNTMCNAKTVDDVTAAFVNIKELLIELYKYKVEEVQE